MLRTFAHVSDLHAGKDRRTDGAVFDLARSLEAAGVDDVLVTGDVTHRGRPEELDLFRAAFARIADRTAVVPGNHDRMGGAAAALMSARRVAMEPRAGLFVVRVDSTAAHNRRAIESHGELTCVDLDAIERAIDGAPLRSLVVVMLHHHVTRLRGDHFGERAAAWLGLPHAAELALGSELLERVRGRCDVIIHGHRHTVSQLLLEGGAARPLRILNAGSTTEAGRARIVAHEHGRVVSESWLELGRCDEARQRFGWWSA